jgi:hypothetical protein
MYVTFTVFTVNLTVKTVAGLPTKKTRKHNERLFFTVHDVGGLFFCPRRWETRARLFKRNVVTNLTLIYLGVKSFS